LNLKKWCNSDPWWNNFHIVLMNNALLVQKLLKGTDMDMERHMDMHARTHTHTTSLLSVTPFRLRG